MKNLTGYILLYLKGIAMGGADVIPGISGGTIAFITGIYEKLLNSIKSIDLKALQLLKKFEIKALWEHVNGTFLLVLFGGFTTSIFSLAKFIIFLLESYPIQVWSFFFGLIIISALIILREIKKWNFGIVIVMLVGIAITILLQRQHQQKHLMHLGLCSLLGQSPFAPRFFRYFRIVHCPVIW